ncbi:uncharacterized protein MONBRDRAFT_20946 [Monosiga brevicollis MX1]|uniref:Phospholipase B-like n=1 Tax=Monosiga brevicollis TaxID=81824 RepID=A9UXL0_MONBE|nr:uncharacterized protein MONBRDRAFT_20946 [Monosiga brevicollis MX1]EDQ90028.1 predicted protein [Monosiga brevicollis MX1]|eukprot:XP_001745450.1 hypothetical protein [Monosiga brevicollis MX1]
MSSLNNGIPEPLLKFLAAQFNWTRSQVAANQDDVFWQQVGLIMAQYDGLRAGYGANVYDKHVLPEFAFQLLNGNGDFFDIIPKAVDVTKMSSREFHDWRMRNGRCSALIKLTGDFSDLFMSHSAWYIYQAMNRIYKHCASYNFQATITHAKKISFSSYPGYLESLDDFYLMSSGLVMLQTTNNVFNTDLQQYIQPESLQSWIRIRTATALAQTSEDWAELAGRHNSGTYNNQYMVMDLNKFTPGQPLLDGTLYVAEQIPGTWEYADVTKMLSLGYWPSYNVPFFEKIYNLSGYPAVVKQHGTDDSYELAPRAKIFRRDQTTVVDLDSFKAIMRYNDYKNDPYAKGDPYNAICSRGDLESDSPSPGGCYDTKVTTYSMALKLQSQVINGPTTSHGLPPFSWSQFPNASHLGMPEVFNFTFETMDAGW